MDTQALKVIVTDNCVLLCCLFGNKNILVYQDIHLLGVTGGGDGQNLLRKDHDNIYVTQKQDKSDNDNHTNWAIFLRRDFPNIFV